MSEAPKPKLNIPSEILDMVVPNDRSNWKPPELQHQERVARTQAIQNRIAKAINEEPAPIQDILAAISGIVCWLLAMNCNSVAEACKHVIDIKKQQLKAIPNIWRNAQEAARQARERQFDKTAGGNDNGSGTLN